MSEQCAGVCAVVVAYRPDFAVLTALIDAVVPQVGRLVVVDNDHSGIVARHGVSVLPQAGNIGLAAAFNVGIAYACEHGFDQVLLLDQDSEPTPDMVARLAQALETAGKTARVAAVGPCFQDIRESLHAPFVRFGFPFNKKIREHGDAPVACDFLISSGSLIPLASLEAIGVMDADLFIDNIDLEWSCRARAAGYELLGIGRARMHHRLGDSRRRLPLGVGHIVVHGPLRLYYMMRNRVLLYRMPHVPRVWVAQDLLRVPVKFFMFAVLVGPRLRNIRFMLAGLLDGARNRRQSRPPA